MKELSPAAQSILDAYVDANMSACLDGVDKQGMVHAIRAAANLVYHSPSAHMLYAIADELEANDKA
jgi:hypothetical protein